MFGLNIFYFKDEKGLGKCICLVCVLIESSYMLKVDLMCVFILRFSSSDQLGFVPCHEVPLNHSSDSSIRTANVDLCGDIFNVL